MWFGSVCGTNKTILMKLIKYALFPLIGMITIATLAFTTVEKKPVQKSRLKKIVIDPGHGGKDGGAPGKYSNEKDIALAISLKLQDLMSLEIPDVEIVMTRNTDVYHSPVTKANIANQAKGDLFICIHCNSADGVRHSSFAGYRTETYYKGKGKRRKAYTKRVKTYRTWTTPNPAKGTETYIWGAHKNERKEVAMRENEGLYADSAAQFALEGFDTNSPEKMNFINLKTRQFFDRSAFLALAIQDEFALGGRINRDALQRQIGIWVLQAVAMPAVLVETGYISNPEEEDYLNSECGQYEIAQAIVNAVKRYRQSIDSKGANRVK